MVFVAARTSPALLAALLLGEAKDVGMAIIRDALCNQHGDLLKHKYYCIRLHFFNIYSYGMQIAPGLQGRCWLAGQSCSWGKACWLWGLELHRSCCHPDEGWASEAPAAAQQGCWSQAWCCKPKIHRAAVVKSGNTNCRLSRGPGLCSTE